VQRLAGDLGNRVHIATSIVPIPIERSLWPPDFSFCIIAARIFSGAKLSPASLRSAHGSALRMRGMNRARICAPQA